MKKSFFVCAVLLLALLTAPALAASSGIVYPGLPLDVAGYDMGSTNLSRFRITSVEYQFTERYSGKVDLEITLNGKKTYDADGDTNIRFSKIRVDLYDALGARVASESISTGGQWVGSGLYFASCTFYFLEPGHYTLAFRDQLGSPIPVYTPIPTLVPTAAPTPAPTPSPVPVLPGDINADGVVDGRDVLRLARHLAGHAVQIDPAAADLNGDSSIDGRDLLRLAKRLAGV